MDSSLHEIRRKKEHGHKGRSQHHLPLPLEKWDLCVLCIVLNPGIDWSPMWSFHEPQGWGSLALVPIGAPVFECLGDTEIRKTAQLQWPRGKRQRPHGVFVGS